jgi:hypothetical protein
VNQVVRHLGGKGSASDRRLTRAAYLARCRAACPAELAPPTTNTSSPATAGAITPRCAVEHPCAGESVQLGNLEMAVGNTGRENHRSSGHLAPVPQSEHLLAAIGG